MPLPRTTSRRRARSTEIADQHAELQRIEKRRSDNAFLFEELLLDHEVPDDLIHWHSRISSTAHNRSFIDYEITTVEDYADVLYYTSQLRYELETLLTNAWMTSPYGGVSFNIEVVILYYKLNEEDKTSLKTLTSQYYPIFTVNDIIDSCSAAALDIVEENEGYQDGHSNWVVEDIKRCILKYQFVQPSSVVSGGGRFHKLFRSRGASSYIKEPDWLSRKHCLINVQNKDDLCFKYVMECAFIHKMTGATPKDSQRDTKYKGKDNFQYGDLTFPIHLLDIEKFEHLNMSVHNLALHVYFATSTPHDVGVLYRTKNKNDNAWHVELLIIIDEHKKLGQTNSHWIYITNYERFLVNDTVNKRMKRTICEGCTMDFSPDAYTQHLLQCGKETQGRPIMPLSYEKFKYFTSFEKTFMKLFVIYADFEAFNAVLQHNKDESKTEENRLTEHVCASFCFHTVCRTHPEFNKTVIFSYNKNDLSDKTLVARTFIDKLEEEAVRIHCLFKKHFLHPLDMGICVDDGDKYCKICKLSLEYAYMPHWSYRNFKRQKDFSDNNEFFARLRAMKKKPLSKDMQMELAEENHEIVEIWDNSQPENNYIGKAHFACAAHRPKDEDYNLIIPVVFHNLGNYDSHFILKALDPRTPHKELKFRGIPKSSDKFMSFTFHGMQFIDSLKFMNTSLSSLATNLLKAGTDKFKNFNHHFKDISDQTRTLLLQKGEFPYEYFNHPSVFKETSLPSIQHWYNTLRDEPLSDTDYQKAQNVWSAMNCSTFQQYHDLYLIIDVLLLADIFENFRDLCYSQYRVDPANYISLPGLCMDASFIFAGSRQNGSDHIPFSIDLFDENQHDMYLFIEDSIRGGVSMTPGRYAKANHKYLDTWDPTLLSKYILYLDANNLYGYAMNQSLPFADYSWMSDIQIASFNFMSISRDSPTGYILEVDGYFPHETHDYLRDFPPAPLKQRVTEDMISPFSVQMNTRYHHPHDNKTEKLLCTLEDRKYYKCYYGTLQLYCTLGFVVTKVHRILRFRQSRWLADFINHNTSQRAKATNAFEKDFYKLVNNANYGKFIQNNRKFRSVQVIDESAPKITWSPYLTDRRIINENFVLGTMYTGKIDLNSAVIVGSVILDHSKYLMYMFYYQVMKTQYSTSLRLIFTDTDSLCMEIAHDDPIAELKSRGILDFWFDLSEYPECYYGQNYRSSTNKKVIGKFKDEMVSDGVGLYITEVVALASKMYSILKSDGKNKQTAKGVASAVKRKLHHDKYVKAVLQDSTFSIESVPMISLQSSNNIIHTISMTKNTISPCDSKLYLLDSLHTLPYGHYSIPRST